MNTKRLIPIVALAMLMAAAALAPSRAASQGITSDGSTITLDLKFRKPRLVPVGDGVSVRIDGLSRVNSPGNPDLPARVMRVALPPDADLGSVRVSARPIGEALLLGAIRVLPQPPLLPGMTHPIPIWGQGKTIVQGRNLTVYGRDALHPMTNAEIVGFHQMRKWRWLDVAVYPCQVNPIRNQVRFSGQVQVKISFQRRPLDDLGRARLDLCTNDGTVLSVLDNASDARTWYDIDNRCAIQPQKPGFVIITTKSIYSADNSKAKLDEFKTFKEQTYDVWIVTEDDYDSMVGHAPNSRAERIRKWLQDHYEDPVYNIEHVLLIGNPDPLRLESVPMKYVTTTPSDTMTGGAPTDSYYANLSGDWDLNDDGLFCDYFGADPKNDADDDFGPGGCDLTHEVNVGRIPVYDAYTVYMEQILDRSMAYTRGEGDLERRRHILIPASVLTPEGYEGYPRFDGSDMAVKLIKDYYLAAGLKPFTLYETEGVQPSKHIPDLPINSYNVVGQWRDQGGFGLVTWYGHGEPEGSVRTVWTQDADNDQTTAGDYNELAQPYFMHSSYLPVIGSDVEPAIVFLGSCSNGEPETVTNLGYSLIKTVAVASLPASRLSWGAVFVSDPVKGWIESDDGDSFSMGAKFTRALLEGGMTTGKAWSKAVAQTTDASNAMSWYSKAEYNIYGDPTLAYFQCTDDSQCDDGIFCNGAETCDANGMCKRAKRDCSDLDDVCHKGVCVEEQGKCVAFQTRDCPVTDAGPVCNLGDGGADDAGPKSMSASTGGCSVSEPGSGSASGISRVLFGLLAWLF